MAGFERLVDLRILQRPDDGLCRETVADGIAARERRLPSFRLTEQVLFRALRRLASICRKLVIEHRPAMTGFRFGISGTDGPAAKWILLGFDSRSSFLVRAGSLGFGGAAEGRERTERSSDAAYQFLH